MPRIKTFRAVHPSPEIAGKVALQVESLSIEEAKQIRGENPLSYINMLVPKVENPFERASRQELAFKKINENLEDFLDRGILIQDDEPSVYVYRTISSSRAHTGIWTLTHADDYLTNTIRRHELTREDRERGLIDYLRETRIDANPVLITYPPDEGIDRVIQIATRLPPVLKFDDDDRRHFLWKISDPNVIDDLLHFFESLPHTYIADGHHRAAAACGYSLERRKLNLNHTGKEEYNFFTSVYMSTNELEIIAFHRLVKDLGGRTPEIFIKDLKSAFSVVPSPGNAPAVPSAAGIFGLYTDGGWYTMRSLNTSGKTDHPADELDVSILQKELFGPLLQIHDPRVDPRLHFAGGNVSPEQLSRQVDEGTFAAALMLYPTSMSQLTRVADSGQVMPPKSTWFEPKFQAGLLIHQLD